MKKEYKKPKTLTILLQIQTQLLIGSNTVNDYNCGSDITVGDEDDPSSDY